MSGEDWHGWCHSEGMSGNCGIGCDVLNGLHDEYCEAADDILESYSAEEIYDLGLEHHLIKNYEKYIDYFVENLGLYIGELRYQILKQQTEHEFDPKEEVRKLFK